MRDAAPAIRLEALRRSGLLGLHVFAQHAARRRTKPGTCQRDGSSESDSPRHDAPWQYEWTERQNGEFVTKASATADALEEAVPVSRSSSMTPFSASGSASPIEARRCRVCERAEARQRAKQTAKQELCAIVKAWSAAFAIEAFFNELSRRAQVLEGD